MEELRGAPSTLSLQQFAAARATELLSLHSALKARKRKASTLQDAETGAHDEGIGDESRSDQIDGSFPRHLRRRTSCYLRRRLPLPCLYNRKRRPFLSSSPQPKKRRRRRRRQKPLGKALNQNAHQVVALFDASGSDSIGSGTLLAGMLDANYVAGPENVASADALIHVGCDLSDQKMDDVSAVSLKETNSASTLHLIGQSAMEDGAGQLSQNGDGSILHLSESNSTSIVSQAAQPEIVPIDRDHPSPTNVDGIVSPVQGESHGNRQDFKLNEENGVCLSADTASMHIHQTVQEKSYNHPSVEEPHTTMVSCSPALGTQTDTFDTQVIRNMNKKKMCRALRRLLEFKPGGSLIARDGTRRLGTHVWHAKRFTISKLWGYYIPIGRQGRGRGSRAILRWSNSKALLQDNSFTNAIQLVGKQEDIVQVLKPVLQLPQDSFVEAGKATFSGRCFITGILHHPNQVFLGVISPVIMMWKPVIPAVSASGCTEKLSGVRNLWLWVHAGAFVEAYGMLKDICLPLDNMKEDKVICYSRKGDLGQIDLIGEGSLAVLEKVLFPVCRDLQGKVVKVQQMDEVLNSEQKGNAVVYLEVADPRLKENERCLALEPVCVSPVAVFDDRGSKSKNFMDDGRDKRTEAEVMHKEETCNILCSGDSGNFCYLNNKCIDALWTCDVNTSKQIFQQPVKEKFLSRMRHIDRLDAFGLTKTIKSNRMLERRKNLWQRFTCPIILLKHEHERVSGSGWSLILPMSWIVAFWVPLIFAGGHVIGVRERHWLCTDAGCPTFPDDFPDCKSYAEMKIDGELHDVFVKVDNRKKPLPEEVCGSAQDKAVKGQLLEQKDVVQGLLPHSPSDSGETAAPEYNCFVARTADQLVSFLKVTHQIGLLIFPLHRQPLEKFKGLGSCLRRGTVVWRPKPSNFSASPTSAAKPICLLRVCLRPFCRGVAKVGAKVYAPTPDDYITWSGKEKTSKESVSEVHGRATAVGYVTSMAPRGSKVSSAIAFCDVVALGLARQHQWVNTTWDKNNEIFLMFSNNGSTVFRPSFGSICIEAGPDI